MGTARLRIAALAALAIAAVLIGLYRLTLTPGSETSIALAMVPAAIVAAAYVWAIFGHWFVPRVVPATTSAMATATTFTALAATLSAVTDGNGLLVAVAGGAAAASNLLALVLSRSPLMTGDHGRLK
ncbi:hypothetical protein LF599_06550 [Pseudodesulfovibrio thermohalotolerans]|uniref:hypothetical protein n=1 Tax=Pseudodesulfovibrio thermohalotolerans TaxID=2880651 RepID=UPI002442A71C|nr:hypothetical protein [Pseudodesulfovibrio thermohalotolerans]WFS63818.1 hypothetical protein LF599_06550 [Pseudodesulfovibrio thermohalotolerans]